MEFEKFPSLTRFSQGWTITEKIDGTNAQVAIFPESAKAATGKEVVNVNGFSIYAGSRSRWLSLEKDNFGFARYVHDNAEQLVNLGVGRHYGEWFGSGIQRTYGLTGGDKRLALFNVLRDYDFSVLPDNVSKVPYFYLDEYLEDPYAVASNVLVTLRAMGSSQVPGFMDPEGIVLFHRKSGTAFKKTFDYDDKGKWAENQVIKGSLS